jgi:hypothetical protein
MTKSPSGPWLPVRLLAVRLSGAPSGGRVLLCGSLVAVAEAMEAFGGTPGEWL